jgi:hypothetical protein
MYLCGDAADHEVIHTVLGEHAKQLPQIQWPLELVAHELA